MQKKNVIFILQDHQLFYKHDAIKRPNYDKFCSEGITFTNAVSVTPLCGPARRSMLNGMYAHKHGQFNNGANAPFNEQIYFDVLRENGYRNYYYGKWHAGDLESSAFGCEGFTPEGYSSPYKYPIYDKYLREKKLAPPEAYLDEVFSIQEIEHKNTRYDLRKLENLFHLCFGEFVADKEAHECFFLANLAIEQLEKLAKDKSDKPFTLRVDFWGPHQPYYPTKEFLDMYDEDSIELYPSLYDDLKDKPPVYKSEQSMGLSENGSIITPTTLPPERWKKLLKYAYAENTMLDYAAGRIIDKVKELGLDENTLIIWSADHGDALCSHGGHIDKDCYLSEEVLRIPLAISADGKKGVRDDFVSNLDIPATILDYGGMSFKDKTDAVSLLSDERRETFVSTIHGHFRKHSALALRKGTFKFVENHNQTDELYNLATDPYELTNLINSVDYANILKDLKKRLETWKKDYCYKTCI